ncbi:cytochrome B [Mucilaginibacter boryungensis]|uniref:Cytochrome B n=1 Tax=Mucilaginibacter boryungensis TaxID=768480 RepID=A0ABR9XND5_9SPHI|nr:cytochrome B [Mucilaginibacter boryungensis]MBE9668745.1 cytochrome B [Mucilaginibacter boryungensis]
MYTFFKNFHSGFRYIVFILVLIAIIQSLAGWLGKKPYTNGNRKMNLFAMISAHTQLLIGLILYFLSPLVQFASSTMKNNELRYWTVEHISMMIIAIVLITIGHSRSKKAVAPEAKHRAIAIFYILATLVIVVAIIQSHRPLLGMTN